MRVLAILVIILGIAAIVFGILYIPQANSARQKVADSLTPPVTLDNLGVLRSDKGKRNATQ